MSWLAIDFEKIKKSGLKDYAAGGRLMVVLDGNGNVILEKEEGEDWTHPTLLLLAQQASRKKEKRLIVQT